MDTDLATPFADAAIKFTKAAREGYPGENPSQELLTDYGQRMQKIAGVERGDDLMATAVVLSRVFESGDLETVQAVIYSLLVGFVAGQSKVEHEA